MSIINAKEFLKNFIVRSQKSSGDKLLVFGEQDGRNGIVVITHSIPSELLFSELVDSFSSLESHTDNDTFACYTAKGSVNIFIRVIYPASDEKIAKYSHSYKKSYVSETPEEYRITIGNKVRNQKSITWIKNIIAHGNHILAYNQPLYPNLGESLYYNDENFVLIGNYKWNKEKIDELYLVLLFKADNLYTIREVKDVGDLLLARDAIYKTIKETFYLDESDVIVFFHYHPTYYSLHLHVVNVNLYGDFINAGRVILLDDAIERLTSCSDYYKNANLSYIKMV